MALDMSFANTAPPGAGSGVLGMPTAAPPQVAVPSVLGPAPAPPAAPSPQGGGPLSGIAGVIGGIASLPGNYLSAMGAQWQDAAAQHQMNMQMAQAKLAQFKAQMAGLQEVRQGIKDPTKLALFDADPFAYVGGDEKVREATLTPQVVGKSQQLATFADGPNKSTLVPDISISPTGDVVDATRGFMGQVSEPHFGPANESGQRVPLAAPAAPIVGAPAGQPGGATPPGQPAIGTPNMSVGGDPVPPPPAPPGNAGPIQPSWGLKALAPPARAVAAQIIAHPAVASMDPQDQANVLGIAYTESRFRAAAQNGSSTSYFQFQQPTFDHYMPGGNIHSLPDQIAAEAAMYRDDQAQLSKGLGTPPTPGQLYLAAQQGPGGALALLKGGSTPAVTALVNAGVPSGKALASIAGNIPGVAYSTPAERQQANSLAMKMTAAQFAQTWDQHFAVNMRTMFGGSHVDGMPVAVPGGPTMSVGGQPVPAPPPAPGGGPGTVAPGTVFQHGQATDIPIPAGDPRLAGQPNGSVGMLSPEGHITVTPPPVTASDFNGMGQAYANDTTVHQPAVQRVGDLAALSRSLNTLPASAMQSQQALLTYFGNTGHANTPRPKTLDDLTSRMGISEDLHGFISKNNPSLLGQDISPASLRQLYRAAWIGAQQSNQADAQRVAPIAAAAKQYGYADNWSGQHPTMPNVPPPMQDPIPPAAKRKTGATYWAPIGPVTWTGKGWRPQ